MKTWIHARKYATIENLAILVLAGSFVLNVPALIIVAWIWL